MRDATDRGRASFARGAWGEAYALLSVADAEAGLDLEDLERLGATAYLVGRDEEAVDVWGRAHREACGLETSGGRPVAPSGRPSCC